ncbi:MAG TPA: histidine kinase [Chitinophagaceae bacterium]|nr:histidine kinase [Chitinophagaceae bacterium]
MTPRQTILHYKFHHVLFWLMVTFLWFYLRYQDYDSLQQAAIVTIIKMIDLVIMIYFANIILVPKLLYRKKYSLFVAAFFISISLSSYIKMLIMGTVLHDENLLSFSTNVKEKIYNNFITHFFLVLAGVAVKLIFDYVELQRRMAEVAKEKAEAELNFLKSQINPHFLFNSLNSVYFLIDKKNTTARTALHQFSDMLRYQLYECNGEKIPVEKEINYLKDYVDLQRLRINDNCSVQFNCTPDVKEFSIEPLLLIPFVENSFKHLSNYKENINQVKIDISRNNGTMHFTVENTTDDKQLIKADKQGGIGLNNVKKRLDLLYPGKYNLQVNKQEGWYGIDLTLSISNES